MLDYLTDIIINSSPFAMFIGIWLIVGPILILADFSSSISLDYVNFLGIVGEKICGIYITDIFLGFIVIYVTYRFIQESWIDDSNNNKKPNYIPLFIWRKKRNKNKKKC